MYKQSTDYLPLSLYPRPSRKQRAAPSWMVLRERGRLAAGQHRLTATHCGNTAVSSPAPPWRHPTLMRLRSGALSLWADVCGGELYLGEPPGSGDVRGGFFCDEPVGWGVCGGGGMCAVVCGL